MLAHAYNIIIDHGAGYTGHGREVVAVQYTRYPSTDRGSSLAVNNLTLDIRVTSDRPSTT